MVATIGSKKNDIGFIVNFVYMLMTNSEESWILCRHPPCPQKKRLISRPDSASLWLLFFTFRALLKVHLSLWGHRGKQSPWAAGPCWSSLCWQCGLSFIPFCPVTLSVGWVGGWRKRGGLQRWQVGQEGGVRGPHCSPSSASSTFKV